ncbi:MAG: ATP-binding protein, partial [Burkholderiaceae bacterium]
TREDTTLGLSIRGENGVFALTLTDIGTPFFPPDNTIQPDPCSGAEGGYGLALIAASCDEVRYAHQHGINVCQLRVTVEQPPKFAMSSQ